MYLELVTVMYQRQLSLTLLCPRITGESEYILDWNPKLISL